MRFYILENVSQVGMLCYWETWKIVDSVCQTSQALQTSPKV